MGFPQITISVIVTCFNRERTIERALESIICQGYSQFEVLVVDDGSTDDSVARIMTFNDPRIRLIRHSTNRGQNAAINTALKECTGDLIAFLDSDDTYHHSFLERMIVPFLESDLNQVDFAYCRIVGGPKWSLEGCNKYSEVLSQGYLSSLGTLVVRRELLVTLKHGLPEMIEIRDMCQDDRLCFELSKSGCFSHVPAELYNILGATNSVTRDRKLVAQGWERLFQDYSRDIIEWCGTQVLMQHQLKVAHMFMEAGEHSKGFENLRALWIRVWNSNDLVTSSRFTLSLKCLIVMPSAFLLRVRCFVVWRLRKVARYLTIPKRH